MENQEIFSDEDLYTILFGENYKEIGEEQVDEES